MQINQITSQIIQDATQLNLLDSIKFSSLGLADSKHSSEILTFIESEKYIQVINNNTCIKGVFCSQEISELKQFRDDILLIIVDDPKWYFFSLVDFQGKKIKREKTFIHKNTYISPSATIAEYGVHIGSNCTIEPNVVIMEGVFIEENVTIRAGTVIGCNGFEFKDTSRGRISVCHDGIVQIKNNVEIGGNCFIGKGFSYRPTILGQWTKLDALVHYAHGSQCGEYCLIAAQAMIAGNVTIGNHVWIGPSASISNRIILGDKCFVTLGSVVTKHVKENETVTGNFAIPHNTFIKTLKKNLNA